MTKSRFLNNYPILTSLKLCFLVFAFLIIAASIKADPGPGPGPDPDPGDGGADPSIDLLINGLDGPVPINFGSAGSISWTGSDFAGTLVGSYTSLEALDSSTIYVSYRDEQNTALKFAKSTDGGLNWTDTIVDSPANVGIWTSLRAVNTSTIFISYYNVTNTSLKFAKSTDGGTSWTVNSVDIPSIVGEYNSIDAVDTNTIFIAYYDRTGKNLKFAKSINGGLTWTIAPPVDSAGSVGAYTSIDAISANTIFISYRDNTNTNLKFAKSTDGGTTWTVSTAYGVGNVGAHTSIRAIDANTIFIAHQNVGSAGVFFTKSTNGGLTWTTIAVDNVGNKGNTLSLDATDANNIFISYRNGSSISLDLKFAKSTDGGTTWTTSNIETFGNVGTYSSIDAIDANTIFTSYYNTTDRNIYISKSVNGGATWTRLLVDGDPCTASTIPFDPDWMGNKPVNSNPAQSTGPMTVNTQYIITCDNGAATDFVDVIIPPPPQPDYVTEGLGVSPGGLTAGQLVTFAATVRNSGAGAASLSSQTRLRLDINNNNPPGVWDLTITPDQTTGALSVGGLEVENWTNAWTAQVGTHNFEVCADVGLAVAETNEGNNCTTQTFTVLPAVTPPVAIAGSSHGLTVGSSHAHSGASATDANSNLSSYTWTFTSCPGACPGLFGASGAINGGSASIPGPTYTPNVSGTYNLLLTVSDSGGLTDTDPLSETSVLGAVPPVAIAGSSHGLTVGSSHAHSGASATDANSNLSSYTWTFTSCPGACPGLFGASGAINGGSASISGPTYTPNVSGLYTLSLTVTDSGGLSNSDTLSETASVAPQPDYVTEGLSVSPGGLTAGQLVTFAATVRNSGAAAASASSQTRLRLDIDNNGTWDVLPANLTTAALAASATEVENWTSAWTAQIGTHNFEVCADVGLAVIEVSDANNCTTQTFSVGAMLEPDLTVGPGITINGTLTAGMPLTFTNNGVTNSGTAPAGASTARFCIDNSNCLTSSTGQVNAPAVGALVASANSGPITSNSWPATAGLHTVYFCADVVPPPISPATGAVTESNEGNNCAGAGIPFTVAAQTLLISGLTVFPNPANPGISRNITATRDPASTALGNINYSFWWNCTNASTNVSTVSSDCGSLPADTAGGGCTTNSNGAKCNGESATSMAVPRIYSLSSTAKVILEQGSAPSAERRTVVNVNLGVSCSAVPATAAVGDTVRWTAFPTGGSGSYGFTWSGNAPLGGQTINPYDAVYTLSGQKTGSITVNDGFTSMGPIACTNSPIDITGKFLTFTVNPTPINSGESTTISWTTTGFTSCTLTDNNPLTAINGGLVSTNCGIAGFPACPTVNLATTTIFTLVCDGISRSVTAQVKPPPSFIEIPPP